MRKLLALAIFCAAGPLLADVSITNIPTATALPSTALFLGTSNNVAKLFKLSDIQASVGATNGNGSALTSLNAAAITFQGSNNVVVGPQSGSGNAQLSTNSNLVGNHGFGQGVLANLKFGSYNTGMGENSLNNLVGDTNGFDGWWNTAYGSASIPVATNSYSCTSIGADTMYNFLTGCRNTCVGHFSLYSQTVGNDNTAIGYAAGTDILTGQGNTVIGSQALSNLTNGWYNVALGMQAGYYEQSSNHLWIDNQNRSYPGTNAALVFGVFDASQSNQLFRVNGMFEASYAAQMDSSAWVNSTLGSGGTVNLSSNGVSTWVQIIPGGYIQPGSSSSSDSLVLRGKGSSGLLLGYGDGTSGTYFYNGSSGILGRVGSGTDNIYFLGPTWYGDSNKTNAWRISPSGTTLQGNSAVSGIVTATNGFASFSTNSALTVATGGITNTLAVNLKVLGFTGTTVTFKDSDAATISLGTLTVPSNFVLQPGGYLQGTTCAASGTHSW